MNCPDIRTIVVTPVTPSPPPNIPIADIPKPPISYNIIGKDSAFVVGRALRARKGGGVDLSPQGTGSVWVITKIEGDRVTIQPVGSKMLNSSRTCFLSQIKSVFSPLDINNKRLAQDNSKINYD